MARRCRPLILDNVPEHEAGSSVGLDGLMRSVGTTVAGAVMAAVLTSRTVSLGGHVIPDESAFRICFVVGAWPVRLRRSPAPDGAAPAACAGDRGRPGMTKGADPRERTGPLRWALR